MCVVVGDQRAMSSSRGVRVHILKSNKYWAGRQVAAGVDIDHRAAFPEWQVEFPQAFCTSSVMVTKEIIIA